MKVLYHISRLVFGAWFLFSGGEYFLPQLGLQPLGKTPLSIEFTEALIHSGLFVWIKAIEVAVGILVLANRWMLAANLAVLPLTVVIVYWNLVLDPGVVEYVFGITTLVFNLAMLWPYRARIWALLDWKPVPDFGTALRGDKASRER
jgi:hypothetical protein